MLQSLEANKRGDHAVASLPRAVVAPRVPATGRSRTRWAALAAPGAGPARPAVAHHIGDPVLDVGRAEPVRDLRSETRGAGGVSRAVSADSDHRSRHGYLRAVSANRGAGPAHRAGPLAAPHDGLAQ